MSLQSAGLPKAVLAVGYLPVIFLALNERKIMGHKKVNKQQTPSDPEGMDRPKVTVDLWQKRDDTESVHLLLVYAYLDLAQSCPRLFLT